MPLTGERAREYQREYKRTTRAAAKLAAKAIAQAAGEYEKGRPVALRDAAGAVGQGLLRDVLERSNLAMERLAGKLSEKVESKKYQQIGKETIIADDNDAQLRAIEMSLGLHERAGSIPAGVAQASGGNSVTIVEMHYHAPQQVVVDPADNACEIVSVRKD